MSRPAVTRKLAAILIADVVDFSRHMERDEAGAFGDRTGKQLTGIKTRVERLPETPPRFA